MPTSQEIQLQNLINEVKNLQEQVNKQTTVENQKKAIDEMNKALKKANQYYKNNSTYITDADGKLKSQLDTLEKQGKSLSNILTLNKSIVQTFGEMSTQTAKFARSTDEWFKKGQELAKEYLSASRSLGISESKSKLLATNFNKSVKESLILGYSIDNVKETFEEFAKETGRNRILSTEEVENIAKLSKGANLYVTEATKMAEQFDLMGLSSEKVFGPRGLINQAMKESNQMGINANKVIKTLSTNMGTMQQYSFKNGVKGMIEMSKLAVKMRVEVSEMLNMADKFYQPEAAIEAAANLQLLGGDIAKAFGDPFTVMYEARNKPEELAKRIGKMTENMVSFNEKTGEFDFPPEARMQLQAVSKELGIGMDSLTEMTRQASKIKSIKMNVSGNILDENLREGIAGMARMKDGKWVVDFQDDKGKLLTKSIDSLSKTEAQRIMEIEEANKGKTDTDYLREIALYSQTFSEKIENLGKSQQYGFAGEMDVYGVAMDSFLSDTIDTYRRESQNMFEALSMSFGDGDGFRQVLRDAFVGDGGEAFIEEEFRVIFSNMTNKIIENVRDSTTGKLDITSLQASANDVNIFTGGLLDKYKDISINNKTGTYVFGPKGSFQIDDEDEYYGKDGTFTAGTNLGMDKNITNVSTMTSTNTSTIGGTATVNVNITSDNPTLDLSSQKEQIVKVVNMILSNGGEVSSAYQAQSGKGYAQSGRI